MNNRVALPLVLAVSGALVSELTYGESKGHAEYIVPAAQTNISNVFAGVSTVSVHHIGGGLFDLPISPPVKLTISIKG
jgi:hypothetical protein